MKENILERILRAESEFDQKLEQMDGRVEEHKAAAGGAYGEGLRALQRERLDVEQALDAQFRRDYAGREQAMASAIERQKEKLRLSRDEKGAAIVKRLKDEILEGFLA